MVNLVPHDQLLGCFDNGLGGAVRVGLSDLSAAASRTAMRWHRRFAGILQRLPLIFKTIASLGVDPSGISPFFTSPMKDFGYDVSDYCDVSIRLLDHWQILDAWLMKRTGWAFGS